MLSRFRFGPRIAAAATVMIIVAVGATGIAAITIASSAMEKNSYETLSAIADGRRKQLQSYLDSVRLDLKGLAEQNETIQATGELSLAWNEIDGDPMQVLQERYITSNPYDAGEKEEYNTAASGDSYDSLHARYHPNFRTRLRDHKHYDLFLFNAKGDLIYSVFKEADYATNLLSGEWKDSGLGEIFRAAMELKSTKTFAFADFAPYGPSNNVPASFLAAPVIDRLGRTIGVVAIQLNVETVASIIADRTGLGETGEAILLNREGYVVTDSPMTETNEALKARLDIPALAELTPGGTVTGTFDDYRDMDAKLALAQLPFAEAGWTIATIMDSDEVLAGAISMRNYIVMIALVILLSGIALAVLFARTFSRPIAALVDQMKALADGDTGIEPDEDRRDEIGDMAKSVIVFRDAALAKLRLEAEAEENRSLSEKERAEREAAKAEEAARMKEAVDALGAGLTALANGDLSHRLEQPFIEHLDSLRLDFNASVEKLNETLGGIRDITDTLDSNAQEVRSATDDLSRRTEQQAAALEETSAALEEITVTIGESSKGATEMASIANQAKTDTDTSAEVVQRAATAMTDIETASKEIASIIDVIEDIAFQTNLLALNAGVEAARAGEAGQGFAVVAQEVRELAQRTSVAAKEIKDLITKSGERVANGGELVRATRDALAKIAEHVNEIDGRITSIATASKEQLTGVQEINSAVGQIDEVTQQNAAMVEETTAVSHSLANDANSLSGMVAEFRLSGRETGVARRAEPANAAAAQSARPRAVNTENRGAAKPAASPARKLVNTLTGAFASKGSAAVAEQEEWSEF